MSQTEAFFQAIKGGDTAAVKAMLEAEPGLATAKTAQGQSALMMAVYSGKKEIRDLLLARGIVLKLHEAAGAGQFERVKKMVEKDAGLAKSFSPDGFPVMALAAAFGHKSVAEYLLKKGAEVNAVSTNGTGYTALTGAVTGGHAEIVSLLLAHRADVNYRYGPGYSPLIAAAANGHLAIVKMLLEHGADLHARTNDGKTALDIAQERGHAAVTEHLRGKTQSRGAR